MSRRNPLDLKESEIEAKAREMCKKADIMFLKWVSPGTHGVPDRILLWPDGTVVFVEFKQHKKTPTAHQWSMIQKLRRRFHHVYVIDTVEGFSQMLERYAQRGIVTTRYPLDHFYSCSHVLADSARACGIETYS